MKPDAKPAAGTAAPHPEAEKVAGDMDMPAAGPHAKPHLTDPEKTPGTGALPHPARPHDPGSTG